MDYIILSVAAIISMILLLLTSRLNMNMKKTGETLAWIKCFDTVLYRPMGIMIGLGGLVSLVLNPSLSSLSFAVLTVSAAIYFLMIVKASQHALGENGILIVEGFSKVIPWEKVMKMNCHQQRLFIETSKKFYSIRVYNDNMAEIESLLKVKNYIQP